MIGSLFSGIGGLELGLERAGLGHVVWQVELSDYCRSILAKHWPDAERFADVRSVGADELRVVDVVCGGFPCQDISSAGRRAGIDGEKSGLWSEYARIVSALRPPLVVIENVAALRSRGLGRVLRDLAARGYDAEWDCVPAGAVGAPHLRDRLFVVAYAHGDALRLLAERLESQPAEWRDAQPVHDGGAEQVADASPVRRRQGAADSGRSAGRVGAQGRAAGSDRSGVVAVADSDPERRELQRAAWATPARNTAAGWEVEPDVGRVAHGIQRGVALTEWRNRIAALGNAVVPQVAEHVGRVAREIVLREAGR